MKIINATIKGIVPMLMHSPSGIKDESTKKQSGKQDYTKEAETALYKNPDGSIYFPSTWIEGTLKKASTNFKIPGRGKKTYKDLMLSSVIIDPENIPLISKGYEVDARVVKVGQSRIIRYRPIFKKWEAIFTINVLDDQIDHSALKEILEYAGKYVGIGDYRPKFGRFEISAFGEKKTKS